MIHLHAEGINLKVFFESLGFTLTNDCITTDTGDEFCSDDNNVFTLYINGQAHEDIVNYVVSDTDQIMLYFGEANPPGLEQYLAEVTDRACIYSGLCPERGTPPPEECGLTCEL